jgi:hypothetical protein
MEEIAYVRNIMEQQPEEIRGLVKVFQLIGIKGLEAKI